MEPIPYRYLIDSNHLPIGATGLSGVTEDRDSAGAHGRLSARQIWAWTLANLSYQVSDGMPYLRYAQNLYEQDTHDRIVALFAALDSQNAEIEAQLWAHDRPAVPPGSRVEGAA